MYRNSIFYQYISLQYSGLGRTAGGVDFSRVPYMAHPISPHVPGTNSTFWWHYLRFSHAFLPNKNNVEKHEQRQRVKKKTALVIHCCFRIWKASDGGQRVLYFFTAAEKSVHVAANVQRKSKYDWEIQSAWTRAMSSIVRRNSAAELSLVYLLTATNIGQMAVRFICGGDIAITNIMPTHAEFSPVYLLTATYRRAL